MQSFLFGIIPLMYIYLHHFYEMMLESDCKWCHFHCSKFMALHVKQATKHYNGYKLDFRNLGSFFNIFPVGTWMGSLLPNAGRWSSSGGYLTLFTLSNYLMFILKFWTRMLQRVWIAWQSCFIQEFLHKSTFLKKNKCLFACNYFYWFLNLFYSQHIPPS